MLGKWEDNLIIFKPFLRRVAHYFKCNEHSLKREAPLDKVTTDQYQQHLEMIMDRDD